MPAARRAQTPRTTATDALVAVAPPLTRWIERLLAGHEPPLTLAQYVALRAIASEGAGNSEIARRTGVSEPAASQLIAALSGAGLIERAAVAADRRRYELTLSGDGARVLRSAETALRRRLSSMLADVPPPEADALARVLETVDAALQGRPPPRRPPPPKPPPREPTSPPGRPRSPRATGRRTA
jgi:DNA-binding MarR family transcriptional regulator